MRVMMKKVFLLAAFASLISFQAKAIDCAYEGEQNALNIQALQSRLMVSALSCGQQKDYNSFMKRFGKHLSSYHKKTKHYFNRVYSGQSEEKLNGFVTSLANQSSKISLNVDLDKFCNRSEALFDEIIGAKPYKLEKIAAKRSFSSMHGIQQCDIKFAQKERG